MAPVVKITLDAETFKALASSTRLTVLRALDQRRKTLTELARDLSLNKATVHEHLQLLTAADLVRKRDDEGRKWIYYELTWRGEKILHPQETTTFNVLLGISMAAAGGGAGMLALALHRWSQERPFQVLNEPVGSDALEKGSRASPQALDESVAGYDNAPAAGAATTTAAQTGTGGSGSSSAPPQTGSGTSAPPAEGSSPPAGSGGGAAGGQAGVQPAFRASSGNDTLAQDRGSLYGLEDEAQPPAPEAARPPFSLDEEGWLGIALAGLGLVSAMLSALLWRRLRPKRFEPPAGIDPAEDRRI